MCTVKNPGFRKRKRFIRSWNASLPAFSSVLAFLRSGKMKEDENHVLINYSNGKYVYHGKDAGFEYAYKTQNGKTFWRYIFQHSLPLRECYHYEILERLGIPVPQVLAVGDTRKFFVLKESFLITSFLKDTFDGRIFMEGGKYRNGHENLCFAYCRKNLLYLAKLHDAGFFHKAAHPRNFLFRETGKEGEVEVFWIDVARLRKSYCRKRAVVMDLHTFFRDMLLPEENVLQLLKIYMEKVEKKVFPSEKELFEALLHFKRRPFSKKKYQISART